MNTKNDPRLTGKTASNVQAIRIGEYDHGDCQWSTLNAMAGWGSFRARSSWRVIAFGGYDEGLQTYNVY